MKKLLAVVVLVAAGLWTSPQAQAQSPVLDGQPDALTQPRSARPETPRRKRKASDADIARMQQRMSMNAGEVKRDQQMEILEARSGTANTSLGRASGPARQYDKGSGGFTVRKFKDNRVGTARQKRGQTRAAGFVDPKGKPLSHKKKKHFLFF
ncbi:hypothetical protein KLP40_09055 [Hymenobacter sp. NST-14]|uniref:hypothetical protein n=1 Tax=Hymenobacter piscis TaxID=2839984 RepID=UPI001C032307|nr:hypothetical protein [Hymenobacter piscis]MBT9393309.1 hypothetical protein [Hymenobacter piscis]